LKKLRGECAHDDGDLARRLGEPRPESRRKIS
jgi:hypothetical protein